MMSQLRAVVPNQSRSNGFPLELMFWDGGGRESALCVTASYGRMKES